MGGAGPGVDPLDEVVESLPAGVGIRLGIETDREARDWAGLLAGHPAPQSQNRRISGQLEEQHGARPDRGQSRRDQERSIHGEIRGSQEDVPIDVLVGDSETRTSPGRRTPLGPGRSPGAP